MKRYITIGVLSLALALIFALPAIAQGGNPPSSDRQPGSTLLEQGKSHNMVPGTGLTESELKELGYSRQEIASIRSDVGTGEMQAGNGKAPETVPTSDKDRNRDMQTQRAETNAGGSGWGAWGLLGLLGLLGLAGRGRARRVEDERVRTDIRRAA
jgi:hypothetical protein